MVICNSLDSNKIYIGKTNNFRKRRRTHFLQISRDNYLKKYKSHLYNAMNLYGNENFTMIAIDFYKSDKECYDAEIELIALCKKNGIKLYNITEGGGGVKIVNPLNTGTEKLCSKCKMVKPNADFTKHTRDNQRDGLSYYCKPCKQENDRYRLTGTTEYSNIGFVLNDDNSKWCVECKQLLPKNSFTKTKKGWHWHCKECANKNTKNNRDINKQNTEIKCYDINITKECTGCNEILPLTPDFWYKDKGTSSGLNNIICKKCKKQEAKTRRKEGKIKIYDLSNIVYDANVLKKCINCNIEKPATPDFFVKDKKSKTGISNHCKECKNAKRRVKKEEAQ